MSAPEGRRIIGAEVSHDRCVGAGTCLQLAPRAFEFNDRLLSVFAGGDGWTEAELREAAESCPMSAIRLIEAP